MKVFKDEAILKGLFVIWRQVENQRFLFQDQVEIIVVDKDAEDVVKLLSKASIYFPKINNFI